MLRWDTSCLDWVERFKSGRTLVPDLPLYREEADRALRIFKRLRVPDLIGKPTMGEVAGPWLFPIVEAIFGSYDPETHRRMINEFFWLIPKKNSKTSTAAAIMVEALIINRRPEAEFVLIAPTKDVADRSFKQAAGTIRADPELEKLFHHQQHIRTITHRKTGAMLQVKAADTDVVTGGKQVGTLVDEIHVLADKPSAAEIMLELRGALTARPDGFLIIITTQSKKPPVGIFKSELNKARDVRDGKQSQPLLPILYELPPDLAKDGGWKNKAFWHLVNPNLGRSVDMSFLERELEAAESAGAADLALFASQYLNVEIGQGLRTDSWAGALFWAKRADATLTLDELIRRSEVVTIGVDGGGLDDLLGVCVLGREKITRKWLVWCKAWAHRIVLERRKEIASKLIDLDRTEWLEIVDDESSADVEGMADIAERVRDAGLLPARGAIGCDPAGVNDIVDELERRGFSIEVDGEFGEIMQVPQGYKLQTAVKVAERRLAQGTMIHDGSDLMTWCVGNAKVEQKGNALMVTKQIAGTAKIDPVMAMFNAVTLMSMNPEASGNSVYMTSERPDGFLFV